MSVQAAAPLETIAIHLRQEFVLKYSHRAQLHDLRGYLSASDESKWLVSI